MGLIGAVIFGLIAGIVAKLLMPGKDPGGCIITSIIGIVGALVGQLIGSYVFGMDGMDRWSFANFSLAVVGSLLLLLVYRLIANKRATRIDHNRD